MPEPRPPADLGGTLVLALLGGLFFVGGMHLVVAVAGSPSPDPVGPLELAGTLALFAVIGVALLRAEDLWRSRRGKPLSKAWLPGTPTSVIWTDYATKAVLAVTLTTGPFGVLQGSVRWQAMDVLIACGWLLRVAFWHLSDPYADNKHLSLPPRPGS